MIDATEIIAKIDCNPEIGPPDKVLSNVRILFADNDEETCELFRACIQKLGWKAMYVSNAIEIMDGVNNLITEGLHLDAVVATISFVTGPKLTSITAVREIRKVMANVPVIFISQYVTSIIREEVRRVGAEIIQKPVDMETLFVRLSQLIYWHRNTANTYDGDERRTMSINITDNTRRATDYTLSTPDRIAEALQDITRGTKQNERGQ